MSRDDESLAEAISPLVRWLLKPVVDVLNTIRTEQEFIHQETMNRLRKMEKRMRQETQDLIAEVAAIRTTSDSAALLLDRIFGMIDTAEDMAALRQATADLRAEKEELAAAITRNTPAENPPPVEPPAA